MEKLTNIVTVFQSGMDYGGNCRQMYMCVKRYIKDILLAKYCAKCLKRKKSTPVCLLMTHICVNFQPSSLKNFGQTQCYPGQKQRNKNLKLYWIIGGIFSTFVARENRKSKGG